MSHGGKGSSPRPFSVDQETFGSNWDTIFGKKKSKEERARREKALDEMVRISEELGLYDDLDKIPEQPKRD